MKNVIKNVIDINKLINSDNLKEFNHVDLFKKVEDCLFNYIHLATNEQLKVIINSYNFKYVIFFKLTIQATNF